MQHLITIIFFVGSVSILAGYLRLITDEWGNIPLNSYRFTGCLGAFLTGMVTGTYKLMSRQPTADSASAIMVYLGLGLLFIGFKLA